MASASASSTGSASAALAPTMAGLFTCHAEHPSSAKLGSVVRFRFTLRHTERLHQLDVAPAPMQYELRTEAGMWLFTGMVVLDC